MPFALRVSSYLHSYVLPLSPCNYNALYRIISRFSFSLDPGGVSRCVPRRPGGVHLYALHRGNVAAVWMARYIYAAAWCSLAVLNAARAAGQNICIFFGFGVIYKYIYIVTPNPRRYARFAICLQTDVSHANGLRLAACCVLMVHRSVRRALLPCGLRVGLADTWGVGHHATGRDPPPWGHPCGGAAFLRIFFYFFLGGYGLWEREGMAWGVLAARGMQHEQDMNVTLRNQGECFLRGVRM